MFEKIKERILKPDTDEELEASSKFFVYLGLFMLVMTIFAIIFGLQPSTSKELPVVGAWFFAGASALFAISLMERANLLKRRISRLEEAFVKMAIIEQKEHLIKEYEQPNPNLRHD